MRPLFLLFILLILSIAMHAQKQNNNWCFGKNAGITFNTNPPSFFKPTFDGFEGVASISDRNTGKLLFYTNGREVYNSNYQIMPNGNNMGNNVSLSSAQGVVIVPFVYDVNKYYVFSSSSWMSNGLVSYSVVDMTLDGGLGDVIVGQKLIALDTGFSEPIVVSAGCNYYWLILTKKNAPTFYAYKITPLGIDPNPVISTNTYSLLKKGAGSIKVSPDNKKLGVTNTTTIQYTGLHDFDNVTGVISNGIILNNLSCNASEFSANSKFFYVIDSFAQYDVTLPSAAAILGSKKTLKQNVSGNAFQRGPDDDIYNAVYFTVRKMLNSNVPYPGSSFKDSVIVMPPSSNTGVNLPQLVHFAIDSAKKYTRKDTTICLDKPLVLRARNTLDYIQWQDGSLMDSLVVTTPGTYWVRGYNACDFYVDTIVVTNSIDTNNSYVNISICVDDTILLKPVKSYTNATYLWSNNTTAKELNINKGGIYWVKVVETCLETTDTFDVEEIDLKVSVREDTIICAGDTIKLSGSMSEPNATYSWNTGSTQKDIQVATKGKYVFTAKYKGCEESDEVNVFYRPIMSLELGADTEICSNEPLILPQLSSIDADASYKWQDGATGRRYVVTESGRYTVQITGRCGTLSDEINITARDCHLFFPSGFSPNGDGRNDVAHLLGDIANVSNYRIRIYNRRGQEVFTSTDIYAGWDGTYNGKESGMDSYYYFIKYTYLGKDEMMKGDIILVR